MKNDSIISVKNSWDQITHNDFEQITQIVSADIPDHYKTVNLISLLSSTSIEEIETLPLSSFFKLRDQLSFLNDVPMDKPLHKDSYTINGRKYNVRANISEIKTAQYLDYTNYSQEEPKSDIVKLTSCFLVPEGHEYGDGYDVNQVMSDINDMHFKDVQAIAFFLQRQYGVYTITLIDYLKKEMKKMSLRSKNRKKYKKAINQLTQLANMVFSHTFSRSLK